MGLPLSPLRTVATTDFPCFPLYPSHRSDTRELCLVEDRYKKFPGPCKGLGDLDDPIHDWTATVTGSGPICSKRRMINLSTISAGPWFESRRVRHSSVITRATP